LVLRSIAYQAPSAPAFFMPSTSGPTSLVPKSTEVFVYTGSSPSAGTAYCWRLFTAALDDPTGATGAASWSDAVDGTVHNHAVQATHWRMTSESALARIGHVLTNVMAHAERA
jgi:thioesterase domain-containing protein